MRINNGTKQDDPKPLLTKYWISPLAAVANCHRMSTRVLEPHSKRGSRPYNKQTHCQRTIGDTQRQGQKQTQLQRQKQTQLQSQKQRRSDAAPRVDIHSFKDNGKHKQKRKVKDKHKD